MSNTKLAARAGPDVALRPSVGDAIEAMNGRWSFGGDVATTFESHIERSVPNYRKGHEMVAALSDYFLCNGATAYELGCSTGALTRRIAEWNADKNVRIIGFELEKPMADAAQANCSGFPSVEIRQADVLDVDLEQADLIVSYYTIQFIRPAVRQFLFDKIFNGLKWGGGFIMFEKVRAPDARFQDLMSALYVDFKLEQGFDEREIIHKSRSLKGVLEPFSTQGNLDMMKRAGFVDCMTIYKHLCFEGFLAIK